MAVKKTEAKKIVAKAKPMAKGKAAVKPPAKAKAKGKKAGPGIFPPAAGSGN